MKTRRVYLLATSIEVQIRDSVPDDNWSNEALGGVWDEPEISDTGSVKFKMWFKPNPSYPCVVHECWHCYMAAMSFMDKRVHKFSELYEEIYAYSFSVFFNDVWWAVSEMSKPKKV